MAAHQFYLIKIYTFSKGAALPYTAKTNTTLQLRERPTLLHPNSTDLQTHLLLQPTTVSPFLPMQSEEQQKTGVFFQKRRGISPFLLWGAIPHSSPLGLVRIQLILLCRHQQQNVEGLVKHEAEPEIRASVHCFLPILKGCSGALTGI